MNIKIKFLMGLIFFYFHFLLSPALAAPLSIINNSCKCNAKKLDPLEAPKSFNFGKFKGQCIDSCKYRPVKILSEKINKSSKLKKIRIGNIFYNQSYFQGVIPIDQFDKLEIGFEEFLPGVNHVFLKFILKESSSELTLKDQVDQAKPILKTRSLILSPEGIPAKNQKYSLIESYLGNYILVHRLLTGEEMSQWTQQKNHKVRFHPLNISTEQVSKILLQSILESETKDFENLYQLFSNNCSTTSLGLIHSELEIFSSKKPHFWNTFETGLPFAGPIGVLRVLSSQNLIQKNK
ncbi:MAG TPA: DUF4105 domain-containing protein [Pseudobdellovibrionaceae bacterium]|nr:DUF4105 domain-containing protein [Pseudobdellovibrionaceae bacterium]